MLTDKKSYQQCHNLLKLNILSKFILGLCLIFIQITIPWIFNDQHNQNLQLRTWNRKMFPQQHIYTSYLASKLWIQRCFKVWNKFHVNLENSQVLFFFLLVPCFFLSRLWWLSWVSADCDQEWTHLWHFSFVSKNWSFSF